MKAQIVICKNHQEASLYAAKLAAAEFAQNPGLTATFAAGDTPFSCYHSLIQKQQNEGLQLNLAQYIGLDEWIGLGPNDEGSCLHYMNKGYYWPAGIPQQQINAFDGRAKNIDAELIRMREILHENPLDLAILGVGVNGHIGFNEPGIPTSGDFSLVALSETTQTVGRKYFAGKHTPQQGATITLQALKKARRIIIIATGTSKKAAATSILAGQHTLPVGAFAGHAGTCYVFDEQAVQGFEADYTR
ncbi:6-phosphogluconolactonase [Ruminococcaceae bacterium OttesenSCG-928-A16]|nr:6-phosphogluconolactonase [Ruminococcaceae bacterium OttesenSCG-928-A16]